ncbi:hypothetical protein PAMP_012036 [Pampus punctatissimus]
MKALQKNQGRTDQMLGAMADVLTSVAMPNQQWLSEGGEADLPSSEEEKGSVQGHWEPEVLDWEQQATTNPERREGTGGVLAEALNTISSSFRDSVLLKEDSSSREINRGKEAVGSDDRNILTAVCHHPVTVERWMLERQPCQLVKLLTAHLRGVHACLYARILVQCQLLLRLLLFRYPQRRI